MEPGRHVVLLDADGLPDGLRRFFSVGNVPGLLDVLSDPGIDIDDAVLETDVTQLSVMICGAERPNSAELLASGRMGSLIDEIARRHADCTILIDAPPSLVSSTPAALAAMVGHVIFIVEAGRTQREEVEASLELLSCCPQVSLVLNKMRVTTGDSFGSSAYN
jgi:Mrp family chromosome partitioning ATPase